MEKIDYTGRQFNMLKIITFNIDKNAWECLCDCGNVKYYTSRQLQINKPKSCGCLRSQNLVGRIFERLTVKERTTERDNNYNVYYLCECKCGATKLVTAVGLLKGGVKSCGCLPAELGSESGKILAQKTIEACIENTNVRNLTMRMPRNNTSGIKGVTWDKSKGKWLAQISFKKHHYYLGRYDTKEEAAEVRKIAEEKIFGDFLEWYALYKSGIAD